MNKLIISPSSSARVASRSFPFPKRLEASSHWRRRTGYSLQLSACFTFELVMRIITFGSFKGINRPSRDLAINN